MGLFLDAVNEVVESGEQIPDQLADQLSNFIQALTKKIQDLETSVEGLHTQTAPQLDPGPFPSSNINAFKYDPDLGRLFVKFHGKDSADSGPTYGYEGVPAFIFDVFRRGAVGPKTSGKNKYHQWFKGVTPSLGAAMSALIKNGGYQYQRLS